MPAGKHNTNTDSGLKAKQYAASGVRDLVADSPNGATCARKIVLLAAGDITSCKDFQDVERGAFTGLPAGYVHEMSCSSVNCTVAFIAYW